MQASPQVLKQHPSLADLIADLNTRFIAPTGLSVDREQRLQQARYELKNKQSLVETRTVFEPIDRLRFLPLDNSHQHENRALLSNRAADLQRQVASHIDHIISTLEARRLLIQTNVRDVSRNANTSTSIMDVFGNDGAQDPTHDQDHGQGDPSLDGFTVKQLRLHLNALEGFSRPMMKTIQNSIQQRAQDVVTLFNSHHTEHASIHQQRQQSSFPRANSLADVVSHTKQQVLLLDRIKESVSRQEFAILNQAMDLFDTLHQTVMVLWEVLTEFMIRYQLEQDQTFKDYFAQIIDTLVLKLEVLKASLQHEVYDNDTNKQLSKFRDALEQMQHELEVQTRHNAILLEQYKNAGQEFNIIVDTYADIMRKIQAVQDNIRRLE
ncbi:MAG: HAUS augmin-like complex subunit 4-domain-containing protein [Benniella sp.]|nr:MAG: HAUS augmin-like complex subunit 4-domain-containing protein [Benniella sp.]